jgi:hypothetical protein
MVFSPKRITTQAYSSLHPLDPLQPGIKTKKQNTAKSSARPSFLARRKGQRVNGLHDICRHGGAFVQLLRQTFHFLWAGLFTSDLGPWLMALSFKYMEKTGEKYGKCGQMF